MIIRRESAEDVSGVSAVHLAAFRLHDGTSGPEATLVEELRSDGDAIPALSLVAIVDEQLVGHVMCSRGRVGTRSLPGLAPLGVLPSHQRQGVGSALMHAVIAAADALDEPGLALLGDPSYYGRFGFLSAESLGLVPPDPTWRQHFRLRPLTHWGTQYRGTYQYAAAFTRL